MPDPGGRISAKDALHHAWIQQNAEESAVEDSELLQSLLNLRQFRTQLVFQKAVLAYIASQQLTQKETAKFRRLFDIFDTDKDGQLTKKDLVAGYKKL